MKGKHLILDLFGCTNRPLLSSESGLEATLALAATKAGATVRSYHNHGFRDRETGEDAWSITVVLEESHLALHSWPESGYVALDMYTCGDTANPLLAFDYLLEMFKPEDYSFRLMTRGERHEKVDESKGQLVFKGEASQIIQDAMIVQVRKSG